MMHNKVNSPYGCKGFLLNMSDTELENPEEKKGKRINLRRKVISYSSNSLVIHCMLLAMLHV